MKDRNHSSIFLFLKWIWEVLEASQRVILITLSIFLVLGVSVQTILRLMTSINVAKMDDIIIISAFWLYFIASSYGTYERSHISAEMASVYIKNEKLKMILHNIASIITIILSLLYTVYAWDFFIWGIEKGETSPVLHIPMVLAQSSVFIGFVLMSFYLIVNLIIDLTKNKSRGM